jgi:hypothetical protein
MVYDGCSSTRLAGGRHSGSVTTENVDVLLDPFESETLVEETYIRGAAGLAKGWTPQKSEGAELGDCQ